MEKSRHTQGAHNPKCFRKTRQSTNSKQGEGWRSKSTLGASSVRYQGIIDSQGRRPLNLGQEGVRRVWSKLHKRQQQKRSWGSSRCRWLLGCDWFERLWLLQRSGSSLKAPLVQLTAGIEACGEDQPWRCSSRWAGEQHSRSPGDTGIVLESRFEGGDKLMVQGHFFADCFFFWQSHLLR